MTTEETVTVHFFHREFRAIFGSFYNTPYISDFEAKIGITENAMDEWMEALRPVRILMRSIKDEEILPAEHKALMDGYTAYWDEKSDSIVFENPDRQWIVYQPENGRNYFDSLTAMEFTVEDKGKLSILMPLTLFELKVLLALIRATYHYLHDETGSEYHARIGVSPHEAEELITRLQKEIEKHSA